MSWLSELRWSNRLEHLYAMIAGDAELDETVPSTYDRKQGFLYKIAEKIQGGTLPAVGENDKGKTLQTNETTGAPEWAEASGTGGGAFVINFTKTDDVWSCDKTYAETRAAYDAGSVVLAYFTFDNNGTPTVSSEPAILKAGFYSDIPILEGSCLFYGGSGVGSISFGYGQFMFGVMDDEDVVVGASNVKTCATT